MKEYLILAWRNIWRNKRRTLITTASVFFAIFFALIMRSMQIGSYKHWTDSIIKSYSGFIQIQAKGYWNDQNLENTIEYNEQLLESLLSENNVKAVIPRFESFSLASAGEQTKGILIVGIEAELEKELSDPESKIVEGEYLTNESGGLLVSQRLAEFLKVSIGDSVTLLSQGFQGVTAAGLFPVAGIIRMPNPELDRRIIFMNIQDAQYMFNADNRYTSLVIDLKEPGNMQKTIQELMTMGISDNYAIMSWKDMNPEIVQLIESDQVSAYIMLALLYMIIGFGVLGTLIMMTTERRREFGVMMAVGMHKYKIGIVIFLEMFLLGLTGILSGVMGSIPVILYFNKNPLRFTGDYAYIFEQYGMEPVMPFAIQTDYFIGQSMVVMLIFVLAIIYPVYGVMKLKEVNALKA